jgi:hypothetical protein
VKNVPEIDLGPFGFPGRVFNYHGRIVAQRQEGDRLLFLFDEAHSNRDGIRLSLLNACRLWELGVLGCVGVEEYPFYFAGWEQSVIEQQSRELFRDHGNDEGVIQRRREGDGQDFRFGKTLKLLRPEINICSVEDFELHTRMSWISKCFSHLSDNVLPPEAPPAARDLIRHQFEQCPTNLERDAAFLKNLRTWWEQNDVSKAAILNAGSSHQERIVLNLHARYRYIRINAAASA